MSKHHPPTVRFGDRERERLIKLFHQLGTDNPHVSEAARGRIDSLLRAFSKTWADLIPLLGGTPASIPADLCADIAALGSSDPDERARARHHLAELLERHRRNWSDLVNELCGASSAAWMGSAPDPVRVNPLELVHYLLEEYVALQPHQYIAVALWALHSHVYDRFMVTPRLALRSPTADSGKTTKRNEQRATQSPSGFSARCTPTARYPTAQ
jgi:hypothetical protein